MEQKTKLQGTRFALDSASEGRIRLLFLELKRGNYIDRWTAESTFVKALSGVKVRNHINWVADKNELKYLIQRLLELKAIAVPKGQKWIATANAFII